MNNEKIRELIQKNRFKYYEVAQRIGITNTTFSVWLRTPLSAERKKRVLTAIDELKKEVN